MKQSTLMQTAITDTIAYFGEDPSVLASDLCARMYSVLMAFTEAQKQARTAVRKDGKRTIS